MKACHILQRNSRNQNGTLLTFDESKHQFHQAGVISDRVSRWLHLDANYCVQIFCVIFKTHNWAKNEDSENFSFMRALTMKLIAWRFNAIPVCRILNSFYLQNYQDTIKCNNSIIPLPILTVVGRPVGRRYPGWFFLFLLHYKDINFK